MNSFRQRGFILGWLIKFVVILTLILLFLSRGLFDTGLKQKLTADSKNKDYVIGFFNGVATSYMDAHSHLKKLHDHYGVQTGVGKKIQYQLFYNDSYGLLPDVLETLNQRNMLVQVEDNPTNFWEEYRLRGFLSVSDQSNLGVVSMSMQQIIVNSADSYLNKLISTKNLDTNEEQKKIIRQIFFKNKNQQLVFVAHSQGNLYGVEAYKYAKEIGAKVAIVHAAPPIDILKGKYVLSSRDMVINFMRLQGHVPAPTVEMPAPTNKTDDPTGHDFESVYFNMQSPAGVQTEGYISDLLR